MGSECRLKFLKNMFFNLMILGNGIIPRYHQSGFIREENTSWGEKDKNLIVLSGIQSSDNYWRYP